MTPTEDRAEARLPRAAIAVVLLASVASAIYLDLRPGQFLGGFRNLGRLWSDAVPPQTHLFPTAAAALVETLTIALLGTVVGFALALPFGLAGARTLSPWWLFYPARAAAAAVRSMPALLWAVVFVILFGIGPLAGVLAMSVYTMGHLAKLQYESLEGLPPEPFEAVRATGAGRFQVARFVAIPESFNLLLSHMLYMFEYNVRASSIVGFVGGGGIGFYIQLYLSQLQYDGVLTLLLVVFVTIVVIDVLSYRVRARYVTAVPGRR